MTKILANIPVTLFNGEATIESITLLMDRVPEPNEFIEVTFAEAFLKNISNLSTNWFNL